MHEPVTVADQPAVLDPDDADALITALRHAATVIGALAGDPAAGQALASCGCGGDHDITTLWWDLQLTAADIDTATTAAGPDASGNQDTANDRNAGTRRNKTRKQ